MACESGVVCYELWAIWLTDYTSLENIIYGFCVLVARFSEVV